MKKLLVLAMIIVLALVLTGCTDTMPTRENNYNTTIEEAVIIENVLTETILTETILWENVEVGTFPEG